jgi:hypothetical protein
MPLQLRDKSDFIPELTIYTRHLKLNRVNTRSFLPQVVGVLAQIRTLDPQSPRHQSSNSGSGPSSQGKSHSSQTHSILYSSNPILTLSFRPLRS